MEYRLNHKLFVTHLTQVYILKQKDWLEEAGQTNPDFFWLKASIVLEISCSVTLIWETTLSTFLTQNKFRSPWNEFYLHLTGNILKFLENPWTLKWELSDWKEGKWLLCHGFISWNKESRLNSGTHTRLPSFLLLSKKQKIILNNPHDVKMLNKPSST